MATYTLTVNGRQSEVTTDPSTPLLWVLREDLRMTGTKYGCGIAACGACTVLVGGIATRSCVLPMSLLGERPVATIEAMANERPVIATAVGCVIDLLGQKLSSADGYYVCERGLLVEGQDPETFARGLARLVEDEALRREIATRGREFVEQNYSKDRLLRDVSSLYRQLMSEARP